jgi:two-component system cell cycle sensor histidine kinase/response regulator CckA
VNQEVLSTNAALAGAHDLASLIFVTTAAPLLILDSELRVITVNPSFHRMFGMSPREAEGQLLYSLSNGLWDIARLREMLERILPHHKVVQDFEIERDFPGMGHRVLALTARQLDGLQQILLGIEDVTGRKDPVDLALRESEERFQLMADTAPVLIWVSGPGKACTFFNKPWLAFTGRTMQQELGDGWAEGVHPEDLNRCLEIYTSSFNARRSFQMEYRLRRSDGEYRWLLDNGVPRFEHGGAFAGYIGSCIDITDVKTTQEEDFAKQKLETVGALAGGIAHDFNNLLGGILAHSELALAELASGSSPAEELQKIRAAAIRGAEIVRQLMIFAGQEREVIELVDVAEILEDMLELLQVSVSKHVKVETDFGRNGPLVRASPTQIRQVAMNLITNASEALGDQDGVIRVTTGRVTIPRDSPLAAAERLADGEYLQLEVTDTGRGMTPAMQARVFDPFFTTKVTGSHGQGLVVVQRIVRSLNGAIRLLSAPGKGATFRILLSAENNTFQTTRGTIPRAGEEAFASREATILVVDDEALLRQAVSKMLRKKGLSVIEASDGFGALDVIRARKDHIDVLLLDVTLPGASSREVYEEAKRLRPGMPVIVTSAKAEEMAAASLATSVERFLRKPFRLGELLETIWEVLPS